MWIDTHCHLEMIEEEADTLLQKNTEWGVNHCFTIGIDAETNHQVVDFVQRYNQVWGALGVHPHNAREYTEEHGSWIKTTAQTHPKIIAIGECGYDFFYNHSDAKEQEIAFTKQLEIAVETGLPVVIHTRNAEKETRKTLEPFLSQGITGVFHCYTSSQELAEFALEAGFYLSFNGIVTFPKSDNVRELLSMTPINRLLLETDAPFLTPVPYRGKKNFPGYLSLVGKYIAEYLTIDESKLAQQVSDNTKTLFHRYPH